MSNFVEQVLTIKGHSLTVALKKQVKFDYNKNAGIRHWRENM